MRTHYCDTGINVASREKGDSPEVEMLSTKRGPMVRRLGDSRHLIIFPILRKSCESQASESRAIKSTSQNHRVKWWRAGRSDSKDGGQYYSQDTQRKQKTKQFIASLLTKPGCPFFSFASIKIAKTQRDLCRR